MQTHFAIRLIHIYTWKKLKAHVRIGITPNGDGYFNPMVASSSAQRISTRNRWTPTSTQLQILESIYEEKSGTPNRRRIREIAAELSEHGQITETNVYNWFQNRRARSKRKQPQTIATTDQAEDAAVTTDEKRSCGDSGGFESYEHILFPSPDLGNFCSSLYHMILVQCIVFLKFGRFEVLLFWFALVYFF